MFSDITTAKKELEKQLKPCPFCGSKAHLGTTDKHIRELEYRTLASVFCDNIKCLCSIQGPDTYEMRTHFTPISITIDAYKSVVEQWNARRI